MKDITSRVNPQDDAWQIGSVAYVCIPLSCLRSFVGGDRPRLNRTKDFGGLAFRAIDASHPYLNVTRLLSWGQASDHYFSATTYVMFHCSI